MSLLERASPSSNTSTPRRGRPPTAKVAADIMPALPYHQREFVFRREFIPLASEMGLKAPSQSIIEKVCAPAVGGGPEVAAYLGNRPLYRPNVVIAWLKSLLRLAPTALPLPAAPPHQRKVKAAPIAAEPREIPPPPHRADEHTETADA
jgi:hypothetical protein